MNAVDKQNHLELEAAVQRANRLAERTALLGMTFFLAVVVAGPLLVAAARAPESRGITAAATAALGSAIACAVGAIGVHRRFRAAAAVRDAILTMRRRGVRDAARRRRTLGAEVRSAAGSLDGEEAAERRGPARAAQRDGERAAGS